MPRLRVRRNEAFTEKKNKDVLGGAVRVGHVPSKDQKRLGGVLLGDGDVTPSNVAFYADCHLARALMMESLASGKEPQLGALPEKIAKDRDQIRKQLAKKYGKDEK